MYFCIFLFTECSLNFMTTRESTFKIFCLSVLPPVYNAALYSVLFLFLILYLSFFLSLPLSLCLPLSNDFKTMDDKLMKINKLPKDVQAFYLEC